MGITHVARTNSVWKHLSYQIQLSKPDSRDRLIYTLCNANVKVIFQKNNVSHLRRRWYWTCGWKKFHGKLHHTLGPFSLCWIYYKKGINLKNIKIIDILAYSNKTQIFEISHAFYGILQTVYRNKIEFEQLNWINIYWKRPKVNVK